MLGTFVSEDPTAVSAKAPKLRELSAQRRVATLLATVRQLETDAVDDALDVLDLLMATKLLAKAKRVSAKASPRTVVGRRYFSGCAPTRRWTNVGDAAPLSF
jgi:hypothetical protein